MILAAFFRVRFFFAPKSFPRMHDILIFEITIISGWTRSSAQNDCMGHGMHERKWTTASAFAIGTHIARIDHLFICFNVSIKSVYNHYLFIVWWSIVPECRMERPHSKRLFYVRSQVQLPANWNLRWTIRTCTILFTLMGRCLMYGMQTFCLFA